MDPGQHPKPARRASDRAPRPVVDPCQGLPQGLIREGRISRFWSFGAESLGYPELMLQRRGDRLELGEGRGEVFDDFAGEYVGSGQVVEVLQ